MPRKARERPRAAALVALLAPVLIAGCGSGSARPHYLDMTRVRNAIQRSIEQQRHLPSTVECPAREPEKAGHKFACIATTPGRKGKHGDVKTAFLVTERDDKGRVSYIGE